MDSKSTPTCGPITGPITDTTTYTYSFLDAGFTPAKSCLDAAYSLTPAGYDSVFTWVNTINTGGNSTTSVSEMRVYRGRDPDCFPSKYPKACEWLGTVQQQQNYIYSPGTCLGGYASATTFIHEAAAAVTTATCCPSGYALSNVRPNIGETFWGDRVSCTSVGESVAFQDATTIFPPNILTHYAPTVMVAWQSSDIARWKSSLPTSTTAGSLHPSESSPTRLPVGTKAGIGIGCTVAVIATTVIMSLLFKSRRHKRKVAGEEASIVQEKQHQSAKDNVSRVELADEATLQEMTGHEPRSEADTVHTRAELM